jgi:hypothetical protein
MRQTYGGSLSASDRRDLSSRNCEEESSRECLRKEFSPVSIDIRVKIHGHIDGANESKKAVRVGIPVLDDRDAFIYPISRAGVLLEEIPLVVLISFVGIYIGRVIAVMIHDEKHWSLFAIEAQESHRPGEAAV